MEFPATLMPKFAWPVGLQFGVGLQAGEINIQVLQLTIESDDINNFSKAK